MALNLSRDARLYVSTNDTYSACDADDTMEVLILDGFSFSQDAATQEIQLNEAGATPSRGQKIFNTALNPVDVSFSTYMRPMYNDLGGTMTGGAGVDCLERVLWDAFVGVNNGDIVSTPVNVDINSTASGATRIDFENSDVHQLTKLYLYFELTDVVYMISKVALNTAEVDFSIDGIAMINWSGQGTVVEEVAGAPAAFTAPPDGTPDAEAEFIVNKLSTLLVTRKHFGATQGYWDVGYTASIATTDTSAYDGVNTYTADVTVDGEATAQSLAIDSSALPDLTIGSVIDEMNAQLDGAYVEIVGGDLRVISSSHGTGSTILLDNEGGTYKAFTNVHAGGVLGTPGATAGTGTEEPYTIPITGGSLTLDNGITFLTPDELSRVNVPIDHFTGTRSITGTITAYLNTGAQGSGAVGELLADLLADTLSVNNNFEIVLQIGGSTASTQRVYFTMNNAHLTIPSVNVEDVVSTEISFTALGSTLLTNDECVIDYYTSQT